MVQGWGGVEFLPPGTQSCSFSKYTIPGPINDWICVQVECSDTKVSDKPFTDSCMETYHDAPRYI
eukprot:4885441-Ditylum_brightwellii.AAC.1